MSSQTLVPKTKTVITSIVSLWIISTTTMGVIFNTFHYLIILSSILLFYFNRHENINNEFVKNYEKIILASLLLFSIQILTNITSNISSSEHIDFIKTSLRFTFTTISLTYLIYTKTIRFRTILIACFATLFYVMIEGYIQLITGQTILNSRLVFNDGSLTSIYRNPNAFGISMFILTCASLTSYLNNKNNYYLLAIMFLSFYMVLESESRGALLTTLVFISCITAIYSDKKIIIVFLLSIIALIIGGFHSGLLSIVMLEDSHRFDIWLYVLEKIKEQPLLGYGHEYFRNYSGLPFIFIHNSILDILYHYGASGLAVFFGYFYFIYTKIEYKNYAISLFMSCFIFYSFLDFNILSGKLILTYMSLIIALSITYRSKGSYDEA